MKFFVKFVHSEAYYYIVDANRTIGLDFLDMVREKEGIPSLPGSLIKMDNEYCDDKNYGNHFIGIKAHILELSEDQARETGLFGDKDFVIVKTNRTLNDLVLESYKIEKNKINGEIFRVDPLWVIDDDKLWQLWEEKNFSTNWREK